MSTTLREQALIAALQAIVLETMDYPPVRPYTGDSYLPPHLQKQACDALAAYRKDGYAMQGVACDVWGEKND